MKQWKRISLLLLSIKSVWASCPGLWSGGGTGGQVGVWNASANWSGCVPGQTMAQDTATFGSTVGSSSTVSLITSSISPTLETLTFNNSSTSFTIVGNASNTLQMNPTPAAPVTINTTGNHIINAQVAFYDALTFNAAASSSVIVQQEVSSVGGILPLTVNGPGSVLINAFPGVVGPCTATVQGNGTFETVFSSSLSSGIGSETSAVGFVINSGSTLSSINQGAVTGGTGTIVNGSSTGVNYTVNGTVLSNNQGAVSNTGSIGSLVTTNANGSPDFLISNTGIVKCQNSQTVSANAVGSSIQASTTNTGFTINGGQLICQNDNFAISGAISYGSSITTNNTTGTGFLLNSGSISVTNAGTITNGAVGSRISGINGSLMMNSGTLSIQNSGTVSGSMGPLGAGFVSTGGQMNGGMITLLNENSASVSGASASGTFFSNSGTFTLNQGTISNTNNGPVSTNATGSILDLTTLVMTGGTIANTNTGSVSTGGTGAYITAVSSVQQSGGVMNNNDTLNTPTYNLSSSGVVTGTGTYTTAMSNGGTVIPGGPSSGSAPGTMTITGSYSQSSAGTLLINIDNPSSFSQLTVNGSAQLGGTLAAALSPGGTVSLGQTFQILTATGGVSQKFTNFSSNFGLLPQAQYFPNYVLLYFIIPPMQQAMAEATYINYAEPLFSSINHINIRLDRQMAQLRDRFSRYRVKFESMTAVSEELLVENSPELNSQVEEKQEQLNERIGECGCDRPWNVYFGPTGDIGRVLTQKRATGFHYDSIGAQAGFDYAFSDLGVGFLFDYDHIKGRVDDKWGKFNINQTHGSVYVTYIRKPEPQLSFNWILGGGYEWYDIRRNVGTDIARGTPHGVEFDALVGMEYTFEQKQCKCREDHWQVVPQLNLQYIYLHVNSYREQGAGMFDFKYNSQNVRSLRSMLGTRINYSWNWTNVVFKPEINLGWQWEFFDKNRHFGVSGGGFGTNLLLLQPGRNVVLAGVDFLVTLFDRYGIEASYDFEWNNLYLDHFFYVGCNFKF